MGSKRSKRVPVLADFGPHERIARGEVEVVGSGATARGRVVTVISRMPEGHQQAACILLDLFEAARFDGFKCQSFERRIPGSPSLRSEERAAHAKRLLNKVASALGGDLWSVIWHVLFFEESHATFAFRVGIERRTVAKRLGKALLAADAFLTGGAKRYQAI